MSWELFTSLVEQAPDLKRPVLHGVGEPMLVKDLPHMVRYLKDRGIHVVFNTNGTVLNPRNERALIEAGQSQASRYRVALVHVQQAMDTDVFHGQWTSAAVLHRSILEERF